MKRIALGFLLTAALFGAARGDEPAELGAKAPAWHDLIGTDDQRHSLAELADKKGVLVVFFANHCPDCELYLPRILDLARDLDKKEVATVLISISGEEEDDLDHMRALARKYKLHGQYLQDRTQRIGTRYGAEVTPQAFLLDKERRLVYRGALDDHWDAKKVQRSHVREALADILAGRPVSVPETEPFGCVIDYEK